MTDQPVAGARKGHGMDWLDRLLAPRRTLEDERRAKRTSDTLTLVEDFMRELREEVREAAAEDRKGYPVEHALRRRRAPHDRPA